MAAAAPAAASGMGQESVAERRTSEGTRQTSVGPAADQRPPKPDEDKGEALAIMKELENPQNVKRLFEPFQKVVRVMQYYIDDSEIQLKGCFVLSLSCVTHFRYVLKCGGLKALLGAMKRFPLDVRLQASGLEALRTLCWTWDGAFQVLHEGGIEATLATAANLPEDEIVQQEAIGVLTTLAARNAEAVLNARGYEFILRGMADHPTSWVQAWGCEALRLFAEQARQTAHSARASPGAAAEGRSHGTRIHQDLAAHGGQAGDEDTDGRPGRSREDDHPLQAEAGRGGDDHPDHRLQR